MHIRKIAAAAGFACGAALTLAPLASADLSDTVDATLASEINSQNSLFELYATLGGVGADVVKHGTGVYDTIPLAEVPQATTFGEVTPLETYLYGANPILAGISSASGPFSEFNGASTEFYDAYNVYVYAAANGGNLDANIGDYLGSSTTIGNALDTGSVSGAAQYFLNQGFGDLKGFDAIFAPNATGVGDITPTLSNEIVQLNNLFELDGKLAGVFGDIAPNTFSIPGVYVGFDTIDPDATNATFNDLVFGAAGSSPDPGSYDIFNGALTEFFNASNVGLFALLNGGDILPTADLFGPTDFLGDGVSTAIGEYLQLGFSDLLGYFIPSI
jgi:hypothetical protein